MTSFHCGFEATRRSHEAEVQRKAEDARKLAAYPALIVACRTALKWLNGSLPAHSSMLETDIMRILIDALAATGERTA